MTEQAVANHHRGGIEEDEPGVPRSSVSHLELRDSIFLGRGGGTFVLVGLAPTEGPPESLFPGFTRLQALFKINCGGRYPDVKLHLTGELPLNFDIRKASADDVRRGESLVIPTPSYFCLWLSGAWSPP